MQQEHIIAVMANNERKARQVCFDLIMKTFFKAKKLNGNTTKV